jgi:hypothetical protein
MWRILSSLSVSIHEVCSLHNICESQSTSDRGRIQEVIFCQPQGVFLRKVCDMSDACYDNIFFLIENQSVILKFQLIWVACLGSFSFQRSVLYSILLQAGERDREANVSEVAVPRGRFCQQGALMNSPPCTSAMWSPNAGGMHYFKYLSSVTRLSCLFIWSVEELKGTSKCDGVRFIWHTQIMGDRLYWWLYWQIVLVCLLTCDVLSAIFLRH